MKIATIFLSICFFLPAADATAVAAADDPVPDKNEMWPLPAFFKHQPPMISTEWTALEKNDRSLTVAFKSTCKKLSVDEKKLLREKFYFGQGAEQIAPTCILNKFEFMVDGVFHEIPHAMVAQFADAPLAHSVKWNSVSKSQLVAFDGGVGTGKYEVLLTFQAGSLVKQQVVAYDPVLKKAREFIQEFDKKPLP
jgi:hypothetical protein